VSGVAIVTVTDVMVLPASGGISLGFAHRVTVVPAQPVIAMIAPSAVNERMIFPMQIVLPGN
jgi:hypothetical protein